MNNFESWGTKVRRLKDYNYMAIWNNLKTIRLGEDDQEILELPPSLSEFYDVSIGNKCNLECPFCYVSASHNGRCYDNICEVWKRWMEQYPVKKIGNVTYTLRPLQIACGSEGEPTIHPQFTDFLRTVYNTGVVPNYTTNGIVLSNYDNPWCREILEATSKYVGGVAVSFGNKTIRSKAKLAIENLIAYGECKIMIHHLISDKKSVDEFIKYALLYGNYIHYHVLLPLMVHGRSNKGLEEGTFEYMEEQILKYGIKNVAFGANFYPYIDKGTKLPISTYPQEAYSKNVILDNKVIITPSSYNLNPIKIIEV